MKIVSEIATSGLTYVLDYIFNQRLGIGYQLVTPDLLSGDKINEPALSYSFNPSHIDFKIIPEGLLHDGCMFHKKPSFTNLEKLPVIFADSKEGGLGFDIFSAIFWMLSRFEEYQPYQPDEHGRFPASASVLFQYNLLEVPVVDHWILFFKDKLRAAFPDLKFKEETYHFQPTIDIDSPWSYQNKGFKRNLGGLGRDVLTLKWNLVGERLMVLSRLKEDPFFTFDLMEKIHQEKGVKPMYFILIGSYGPYDKTISLTKKAFRDFISTFAQKQNTLYLHPSYQASANLNQFSNELKALEHLTGQTIETSRQHYLKITLPTYYQMLAKLNMKNDYSFGYADQPGFRAGTCHPFLFFDLTKVKATNITIHPLTVMDVSLQGYLKLKPTDAQMKIEKLIDQVKQVNGTFISLWHNQSFNENADWKGWNKVYFELIHKATV